MVKRFLASARASSLSIPVWQTCRGPSSCRRMPQYSSRVIRGTHPAPSGARRKSFSGKDYKVRWDCRTQGVSGDGGTRAGRVVGARGLSGDESCRVFDNVHSRFFFGKPTVTRPGIRTLHKQKVVVTCKLARNHQPPLIGDYDFSEF